MEMQKNTKFWEGFRINYDTTKNYNYKDILNSHSIEKIDSKGNSKIRVKEETEFPIFKAEDGDKYNNEKKFYRDSNSNRNANGNLKNKQSINKFVDNEVQTNQMSLIQQERAGSQYNKINKNNLLDQYEKKRYKEEINEEKTAKYHLDFNRSVYLNYGDDTESINSNNRLVQQRNQSK